MKIEIVFDTKTGTTAQAARAMARIFESHGHECHVQNTEQADPAAVMAADLICIGSWVQGLFVVFQHPTEKSMAFIRQLEGLSGKRVVVFCTYALIAGSTLAQMARPLQEKGAKVVGQFQYRGPEPDVMFEDFARSLGQTG